jgi:mRNA-degrading endonuclease toxin of MazEF toxin-antitoxin module
MPSREIAVIEFPYSDFVNSKKRPVLILGEKGDDCIICAITSNPEVNGVKIEFEKGKLPFESTIKYWQIQTILKTRIKNKIAKITKKCHKEVVGRIEEMFLK